MIVVVGSVGGIGGGYVCSVSFSRTDMFTVASFRFLCPIILYLFKSKKQLEKKWK